MPGATRSGDLWTVPDAGAERALLLWFGAGWSGTPPCPDAPGPDGTADLLALMAADVAAIAAEPGPLNTPVNWDGLRMRAGSVLMARRGASPIGLRRGFTRDTVEVTSRRLPYARYFDTEDTTLRHPTFAGDFSGEITRTCLRSADAVTVLPYDPANDLVLLVEQFRPGAFSRGDPHPWVLEPVAGRCDRDEPVEDVARREAREEAGLTLTALERIGGYYPSPGTLTEYLTSFVGICDLDAHSEGLHGLDTEAEDIRTHIIKFDTAMGLIASGEAENGPLLLSLYWLMAHRDRLRGAAHGG